MARTVIGPSSASSFAPSTTPTPIVETRATFGGSWRYRPELLATSIKTCAAGMGLGSAQLLRRYGYHLQQLPGAAFATDTPKDLVGHWVRIRAAATTGGAQVLFHGRIYGEPRTIGGTQPARTGWQRFVAYEPLVELWRRGIDRSWWTRDRLSALLEQEIGRVPTFNARDGLGRLVGNRTSSKSNGTYLFGGTDEWTRLDMLEYILLRFVDEEASGGPAWTFGGDADLLDNVSDLVPLQLGMSVGDALRVLICPELGLTWKISQTSGGFSVDVYPILSQSFSFNGVSLPRNTRQSRIRVGQDHDQGKIEVHRYADHKYSKIRVVGAPIVVCCSLRYDRGSLVEKWSSSLETSYKAGTGTASDPARDHDSARAGDQFRAVYQSFGAPASWSKQAGRAAVSVDSFGNVLDQQTYQTNTRRTLDWIPLQEGYDYTASPATNNNPSGLTAPYLPCMAWVADPQTGYMVRAEQLGIGVSAADGDWGVLISTSPNHLMAAIHEHDDPLSPSFTDPWSGAAKTRTAPLFDYSSLVVTLAFEGDHHLALEHDLQEDGSTLVISVPDAELWYVCPGTAVGVDETTGSLQSINVNGKEIRNDVDRLALVMAGAIARYGVERATARVPYKGLLPYGDLVGSVLTVVDQAGDVSDVQAPITSVEWTIPYDGKTAPTTVVTAGGL